MPWIVGLDEAGYGPNLGPLVQAAIAVRVPSEVGCLWRCLKAGVRRAGEADDGRVLIDDSKLVHAGPNGLARLERTIVGALTGPQQLGQFLTNSACGTTLVDVAAESWYVADESLPMVVNGGAADSVAPLWAECLQTQRVQFQVARCVATPAPRFNALLDRWQSKAAALENGVILLLRDVLASLDRDDPVTFVIDKQGGRNYYAALLQAAFPDAWVAPQLESAEESEYQLQGLGREVRLVFRPRADSGSLPVALASMLAKYLREVFMRQFNRFWLAHVPGLKPTAGYPSDAKRFYDAIRPAMERLDIPESAVWRRK